MRSLLAYGDNNVTIEEKITLRIKADNSGNIYIPTAGYSSEGTQSCGYDWYVSIDGGGQTSYSGTGSNGGGIRVGYGLSPLSVHTVTIRPKVEGYGWLRAFGYKGTSYASSLINIISDKSYKGYANSEKFTGDWYKAYQYYGCNNLINTDEELLPDTLEIIGNNYRYYEYAGCTSLVSNAEEKILKTVKVIGDEYRAYQYQNCTGLTRVDMRAINWASVGNDYRLNQYSGIATDRNQVSIYIEGGIEEGGDWGLVDANVKGIYVYKDLVSDYQTKLSTITSSKIQKNAEWDGMEYEFIEYIALADSTGKIRIPIGGFSTTMSQDCAYDWMVSIDGGTATEYTGTGDDSYISIGSGLEEGSEHKIVIKPKTIAYGWGRAFGFYSTGAEAYIKELIHDSYKCYAVSRADTGAHYKHSTYAGCTNLINSYEKLPTSATTVGDYYMKECYAGCTGLKSAFWEVLHKGATVGVDYRYHEYTGCTGLEVHQGIAGYMGTTYPTNYKYEYLNGAGNNMDVYMTRYEKLNSGLTNSLGMVDNKVNKVYCYIDDMIRYIKGGNWSNLSSSKWGVYYYGYITHTTIDINRYTKLVNSINIRTYEYGSPDWNLVGQINVDKNSGFKKILINGKQSGSSSDSECVFEYVLGTAGNLSTIPTDKWTSRVYNLPWSWSGTNTPYAVGACDIWGNYYFTSAYNGSNYDFQVIRLNGYNQSVQSGGSTGKYAIAVSRNGQFVFGCYAGYKRFIADNTVPGTSFTSEGISTINGSLMFSDDGMTMYKTDDDNTEISQYSLSLPRDTTTAVDTGNRLSLSGYFDMSGDNKYLFRYENGTIYQYTYE